MVVPPCEYSSIKLPKNLPDSGAFRPPESKDRSLRQLLHTINVGAAEGCDLLIFKAQ
jgi:hypothetical protein